jgi:glycosyltransferase involved in cell wall biosynthesis
MNIVMMTNTYLPHVGGVARSVQRFCEVYRERGHRVLVVAPEFQNTPEDEHDVLRIPAIQNFNGSDFSVALPLPTLLTEQLDAFRPDIIHSHHPFLVGDTALRAAAIQQVPLVFTHHTMYEQYTHYVPLGAEGIKLFVIALSTGYANRCNRVFAPSESVAKILEERGVHTPIAVVPTGVDVDEFRDGDGLLARKELGIPKDAYVVGHVGRLAPEKNLCFLTDAVARFVITRPDAFFLVVGGGPSSQDIERIFADTGCADRLRLAGKQAGRRLVNSFHAMDVFAFASKSETQGMVLIEAMAAGVPVVALEAPGAREVVVDGENGRLLSEEDAVMMATALAETAAWDSAKRSAARDAAYATAERFSTQACADAALRLYKQTIKAYDRARDYDETGWERLLRGVEQEWHLWANRFAAAKAMVVGEQPPAPGRLPK